MIEPRHLAIGAISAAIIWFLARIAGRAQPARPNGWRRVVPGPMYWTGIGLGGFLFLLMSYVWLFVGSTRADADQQMNILFWLIVVFGVGTAVCAAGVADVRRQSIEWRGGQLAFRIAGGERIIRDFEDLELVKRDVLGRYVLQFRDGRSVRLDEYAAGTRELLKAIERETASRLGSGGVDE